MKTLPLNDLLQPFPDEQNGEELTYSTLYDDIKEARRADDPSLSQGEWEAPIKAADWSRVRQLCGEGLRTRAKDLQLAGWLTEAMTRQDGFAGAARGLRLFRELLRQCWEMLYPRELEERVGKLEWLCSHLVEMLCQTPLTMPEHGGYGLYRWQESREVENLQRRGAKEYERALKEGRLTPETFDKSARESGIGWFQRLHAEILDARTAFDELDHTTEERFGETAPSLAEIRTTLADCHDVTLRLLKLCGGQPALPVQNTPVVEEISTPEKEAPPVAEPVVARRTGTRDEAINKLVEAAHYFREHEPHSPVAPLAERAARWARMTLEEWMREVIKDKATADQLSDLLSGRRE